MIQHEPGATFAWPLSYAHSHVVAAGALPFTMGSDKGTSTSLLETWKKKRRQAAKPAAHPTHSAGSALTAVPPTTLAAEAAALTLITGAVPGSYLACLWLLHTADCCHHNT